MTNKAFLFLLNVRKTNGGCAVIKTFSETVYCASAKIHTRQSLIIHIQLSTNFKTGNDKLMK